MSQITKCDICGAIDIDSTKIYNEHYKIIVQRRKFLSFRDDEYIDIDVCSDCLKLLREKARKEQ